MGFLAESASWSDGIPYFEANAVLTGGPDCPDNVPIAALANRTVFLKKQIDDAVSGALAVMSANKLQTARNIAMTGDGSWVVTFDGSGNVTAAMTLANTGVAAGTYPVVTIDSKGRVTAARALQSADLPNNAALTGVPTAPTAAPGTNTTQLANTAFVQAAIAALVASSPAALDTLNELAAALGNDPNFATTVTNLLSLKAPLASPALTGAPTAPTPAQGDSSTKLATTEFVQTARQSVPVRQTALSGVTDSNGRAIFISAGSGLACNLSATATALNLAFASGFGAGGAVDYVERITADAAGYWSNLPANSLSYLTITRNGAGNLSAGSTLAPIQEGYAYNQAAQALLHFEGAAGSTTFLDDFGNTWTAQGGAKLQTNWSKFGGSALGGSGANNALNGTSDYIKSANITTVGNGSWALRAWVNLSSLPANSYSMVIACGGSYGVQLFVSNLSGVVRFSYALSTNGSSYDITNNNSGTTNPVIGTPYFVELTFDAMAGVYRLYVNGVQEASTASTNRVAAFNNGLWIGVHPALTSFLNGYVDEFEFLPYCDHPNGTIYSVPAAAKSIATPGYASDWFDISTYTMKSVSAASTAAGSNPTFTVVNRLKAGEVTTNAAGVVSVVSYAYQGKYDSGAVNAPAASTKYAAVHNLGTQLCTSNVYAVCLTSDQGWTAGDRLNNVQSGVSSSPNLPINYMPAISRNVAVYTSGSAYGLALNPANGGTYVSATAANWKLGIQVQRAF